MSAEETACNSPRQRNGQNIGRSFPDIAPDCLIFTVGAIDAVVMGN